MITRARVISLSAAALLLAACASPDDWADQQTRSIGCGPMICVPPKGFAGELCCRSHFDGVCGQMFAGSCTDLPPDRHANCRDARVASGGNQVDVQGCCTSTNECGLWLGPILSGCTSLTQARLLGGLFRSGTDRDEYLRSLPEPRTCDGEPISTLAAGSGG